MTSKQWIAIIEAKEIVIIANIALENFAIATL